MFSFMSLSKSKFFTRAVVMSFVLLLYQSCLVRVALASLVSLVSGTRVVKWTRLVLFMQLLLVMLNAGCLQEKKVLSPNTTNIIQDQPSSNVQKQP